MLRLNSEKMILVVLFTMLIMIRPNYVKAATVLDYGTCGATGQEASVTWKYDSDKVLTISGTGNMADYVGATLYHSSGDQPWYRYRNNISRLVIEEGVRSIGNYAFCEVQMQSISFPNSSLTRIGNNAFTYSGGYSSVTIPASVTDLGTMIFYCASCSGNGRLYVPGTVATLPYYSFSLGGLQIAEIGEGCTALDQRSLYAGASKLILPSTIQNIHNEAIGSSGVVYSSSAAVRTFCTNRGIPFVDTSNTYPINQATITIYPESEIYSGTEKRPNVRVQYSIGGTICDLLENSDYTVAYSNNTNIGTATITITGMDAYTGTATRTFPINGDLSGAEANLEYNSVIYDGTAKTPGVTVRHHGVLLNQGTDYIVAYANNIEEGTATVTITGAGFYLNSKTLNFSISKNDLAQAEIILSESDYVYDGQEKKPSAQVKYNNQLLTEGTDYELTYTGTVGPGMATVTVTGKGRYKGQKSANYSIGGISIENAVIKLNHTIYTYTGSEKKPTPTVTLDGITLVRDVDYKVSYENNLDVGTGLVIITGIGKYSGAVSQSFQILEYGSGMDIVFDGDRTIMTNELVFTIMDDGDENPEIEVTTPKDKKAKKVVIPATVSLGDKEYKVTSIGEKAFYKNKNVQEIIVGNNVEDIEAYAFYGCINLKKLTIGNGVKNIGDSAIRKCTKLESLTLPKSLLVLGPKAINGCTKLKKLIIKADVVIDVKAKAITNISEKAVIKVKKKLLKQYKKKFNKKTGYKSSMKITG
ncbi:leucine-rich repeat domain-containing protein [Butyrivibrio sp. WCD2001]|uniref:leucine-rich repeat domain-containing protein n=1 Tax=Butyrivibrio sp. WCD2001 TaxID=1280681 RepID=UPI000428046B|nr:leucine-rich repeat domain-containing protein [Butyrivibrio sp. WCD2001]